ARALPGSRSARRWPLRLGRPAQLRRARPPRTTCPDLPPSTPRPQRARLRLLRMSQRPETRAAPVPADEGLTATRARRSRSPKAGGIRASELLAPDPHWYKDAIVYEIPVRAYFDGNADGTGDFPGLIEKLDYVQDLGVTAIWILPFYP